MEPMIVARGMAVSAGVGAAAGGVTVAGALIGITGMDYAWPVFALAFTLSFFVYNAKQAIIGNIVNRARTSATRLEHLKRSVGDIHGMVRLMPYTEQLPLPFGGGWALTGDSAALLAHETILRKPTTIVELGSGVSTLILGQILANRGEGRLISIDHDEKWANKTRLAVDALGLENIVQVIHAPLVPTQIGEHSFQWYSMEDKVIEALRSIDALIVDGPPRQAGKGHAARFPAFPLFASKMSPSAMIFVDDAGREDERSMVEQWAKNDDQWNVEWFQTVDGVAILSRDANVPNI